MNISLKKLLKEQTVLHVTHKDECFKKTTNILKMFFKNIIHTEEHNDVIDIYKNISPFVIVIDINLKNQNGINLIKYIRKENKHIPIIVITSNKDTNILIEAVKLNLIDYILKPVDINKLINALNLSAKNILNSGDLITTITTNIKYSYTDKIISRGIKKTKLTKNESRLLELLLANKNKIVKNEDIKKIIWKDKEVSESAFKSLLSRLSNKIGKEAITNSFGIGYGIINK